MTLADFFEWWRTQLGELLPMSFRQGLRRRQTEIAVAVDDDAVTLSSRPGVTDLILDPAADIESSPEVKRFLADIPDTPRRIRLVLAPGEFLVRQLNLPVAARPHLAETVRYQLSQVTPFGAEQCWFACGEARDSSTRDTLAAWLVAIPRYKLSRVFDAIGVSAPESPWQCDASPAPEQPLELSWHVNDSRAPSRVRLRIAWAAMAVLWMVALGLHVNHKLQMRGELEETADALRQQAVEVGHHRDRLAALNTRMEWLAQKKTNALSTLALLDLLSRQLNDQTWLQRLERRDQRLILTGLSSSPANLIGELEALPMLHEVRFETAITGDSGDSGSRFKLSAKLVTPPREDGA